ncbi:hypothetical protein WOLCODRAFT_133521 [Wolfiporia cocos MD-104 SS10]|uniref:Uncharacterized protein n=1 Tax=Wolfiporia cocos (strain MD-104) TaxID=742152 RepID=A0A2H3J478_WOLCO|nr:hypothetical protein WOLCODRAFT_133521 [Wolfiporia cocos MD-104 SS10]
MSQAIRTPTAVHSPSDLPPPRDRKKAIRPVSPPLSNVSLSRFNYAIVLLAALLVAFYAWRLAQWKAEVGGWWNLALGRRPLALQNQNQGTSSSAGASANPGLKWQRHDEEPSVEDRIEELAAALGIPSKDLAQAIAGAVRDNVPPASLSSVSAHETGDAVKYIVNPSSPSSSAAENAPVSTASKGFKAMESAFEAMVGLDEPPSDLMREV